MRIYITHCSGRKDDSLKRTRKQVTPDKLYMARWIQRFMTTCKKKRVRWAIFSDSYGVWFPEEQHCWYNKHPKKIGEQERAMFVRDFNRRLRHYDEIWFYKGMSESPHPLGVG